MKNIIFLIDAQKGASGGGKVIYQYSNYIDSLKRRSNCRDSGAERTLVLFVISSSFVFFILSLTDKFRKQFPNLDFDSIHIQRSISRLRKSNKVPISRPEAWPSHRTTQKDDNYSAVLNSGGKGCSLHLGHWCQAEGIARTFSFLLVY